MEPELHINDLWRVWQWDEKVMWSNDLGLGFAPLLSGDLSGPRAFPTWVSRAERQPSFLHYSTLVDPAEDP